MSILGLDIATFQMVATFAIIAGAVFFFATEKLPLEVTALATVAALLVLFYLVPLQPGGVDSQKLTPVTLLQGFANPVLFTILSLLVIGQGLFQTGAIEKPARMIARLGKSGPAIALGTTLLIAGTLSAFLNNTPVVVIFIPIITAVSAGVGYGLSRTLMPLSFISILGGMTTLIGSSSNLIVAALAVQYGMPEIGFFDFVVPGGVLAAVGAIYVIFVLPKLLPDDKGQVEADAAGGRQFLIEEVLDDDHPWIGAKAQLGLFPALKNKTVRTVKRGYRTISRPFDDVELQAGDIVSFAATRKVITEALTSNSSLLLEPQPDDDIIEKVKPGPETADPAPLEAADPIPGRSEMVMVEAMVPPASRLLGLNLSQASKSREILARFLGIQRRQRMVRKPIEQIRLEAGDVLLLYGEPEELRALRGHRDLLLMESTATDLPTAHKANIALVIFAVTIFAAAFKLLPIVIAALLGALAMILSGCINIRQATRAIDTKIVVLIGAAFALAVALQATGGAEAIATGVVATFSSFGPAVLLSAMFLLSALLTNFLSNQATAALMTPVAISTAAQIGAPPEPFIYGLIFALNCSFGTPIAYQTNLIVMGPGGYSFRDFVVGGFPLILLIWITYSIMAPLYFGF